MVSVPVIALSDLANPSEAVVEAAAKALFLDPVNEPLIGWDRVWDEAKSDWEHMARAALLAAYTQLRRETEQ